MRTEKEKNEDKTSEMVYYANKYIRLGKNFSVLQKRIIHYVIAQLQNEMYNLGQQIAKNKPIERTLFGDAYFRIPVEKIDPHNQDSQVRNALRGLKIPIDDKEFIGDFMLSAKREGGNWVLLFPEKTVHFLTEVSKGLTPLETLPYIVAQSKHTLRMYELLMRFRDTGVWYTTPEDICHFFELPKTYTSNFGRLKQSVLNVAKRELKELYEKNQCVIWFEYEEVRGGRGNKVQKLKFIIYWREKGGVIKLEEKRKRYTNEENMFVYNTLMRMMVDEVENEHLKEANRKFVAKAMSKLTETLRITEFAELLDNKLHDDKVEKERIGALIRHILETDYYVEND